MQQVKSRTSDGNRETVAFETTPKMSTYLVGIVIGEFDFVEDKIASGVTVRVYTPKDKKEQGTYALDVAIKSLNFFNEYLKIPFPLPKLDLVAIPDFAAGAMENWGLITYRECRLLMDPVNTSSTTKQRILTTVAHEIAHQWFGNLVTMEWWTHLWLNEGTAKFMEFLCSSSIFPEYDMWTLFMTIVYTTGLELDCLKKSHPVEVAVNDPDEIDEIFDDISYMKGASIIRMLHSYVGDEIFREGIILYLKKKAYSNAETEDLWSALEIASKKPIRKIMSTWTKQMGFPLLSVKQRQNGSSRVVQFSQRRFLVDSANNNDDSLWCVPVSVSTAADPRRVVSFLVDERTKEVTLENVPEDCWVMVNPGTIGFYRTRYDAESLRLLIPSIMDQSLPPLDRFGIFGDCFALARSGQVSTTEVLRLLQAFENEDNYAVWTSILNCLSSLSILLGHLDIYDSFRKFSRHLLKNVMQKIGWDSSRDESHLDAILRENLLRYMVILEDEDVLRDAKRRFQSHVTGESILPADLRTAVYFSVMLDADSETLEKVLAMYRKTDLHEEKNRILSALGVVRDSDLLKRVLSFALSDEVRAQDTLYIFPTATMTHQGRTVTWSFFKDNWAMFSKRDTSHLVSSHIVRFITDNFVTEEQAKEVEEFFIAHPLPGIERTVQQCIERIRMRSAWLERDKKPVAEFLRSQM